MIRGVGPYSALITPKAGSLFHAVFQVTAPGYEFAALNAGPAITGGSTLNKLRACGLPRGPNMRIRLFGCVPVASSGFSKPTVALM